MDKHPGINVLHLITRMDMGGSAQNTLASCAGLAANYRVSLGFGPTGESQMTGAEQITVAGDLGAAKRKGVQVAPVAHLMRRIHPVLDMMAFFEILITLRRFKPLILHTHTSKAGLLGRVAVIVARVPIVVHTPHGHVFYGHFSRVASKLFLLIERMLDHFTDVTVALTQGEWDDYINMRVTSPHKMVKIHSGVDISRFSTPTESIPGMRASLVIPSGAAIIGTIGWLLPIKGPDILLRAMADVWRDHPEAHLVFVGKGDMEAALRHMVKESGNQEHVHFLGWREDIWNILPVFDVFVLPSRNEGMGRVVVEAMAAGKPVVASRVGGIPDLIEHGVNGYLFPSEDSGALAKAINKLISDKDLAKRMGDAGQKKSQQFSVASMVAKLDQLYRGLLKAQFPKAVLPP